MTTTDRMARRSRRQTRRKRAAIHAAMDEANRMARSRKKGTSRDRDKNMLALGYERIGHAGPVEERFREVT